MLIVDSDQTYYRTNKTNLDNIFLIRDVCIHVNVGVVFLDQDKAFNRATHSYLISALKAFGIGDGFLWICGLAFCITVHNTW